MTITATTSGLAPVRRSPLAAVHERLGAHWLSDRAHWPASYGSVALEREAVGSAAGLADVGPLGKLSVVAPDVAGELRSLALGGEAGAITSGTLAGVAVDVWFVAPDEALIFYPSADAAPAVAALRSAGLTPVELSSGFASLVLTGPAARLVLRDCFPIDVHERVLPDRQLTSGPVAGIRTVVGRLDRAGATSFTLLVARDLAVSLWETLLEVGAMHGLRPVGADALPGRSS